MRKKLLGIFFCLTAVFLVACGSSSAGGDKGVSSEEYVEHLTSYLETQGALMNVHAQGAAYTDGEDLIKHAKEVVDSQEYKDWKAEIDNMDALTIKKSDSSENLDKFIEAFKAYNKIQADYLEALSKATDTDDYNAVNDKYEQELADAQNKFADSMSELE